MANKANGKVYPITRHEGPEREEQCSSTPSLTSALYGGGWPTPRPRRFTPEMSRYPLYRKVGGPQGWTGRVRKISPLPGLDPGPVETVASHYTD